MVTAEGQRDVRCLCECLERVVRTWDKGSIGARRSCLREACRPGRGSLLWEELVFDGVLRSRPGDGRLDDEAVSGLTTGMVSSAQLSSSSILISIRAHAHAPTLALLLGGNVASFPRGQAMGDRFGKQARTGSLRLSSPFFLCNDLKD